MYHEVILYRSIILKISYVYTTCVYIEHEQLSKLIYFNLETIVTLRDNIRVALGS